MSTSRPSARLEAPTAVTKRISSVAYAVEEIASDEKTARPIVFGMRWCSCSEDASGRPTKIRFSVSNIPARMLNGRVRSPTSTRQDRVNLRLSFPAQFSRWYGTEITTVPLRNSSRPLSKSALWLWSKWPHHDVTTNSGNTTVTMSFS